MWSTSSSFIMFLCNWICVITHVVVLLNPVRLLSSTLVTAETKKFTYRHGCWNFGNVMSTFYRAFSTACRGFWSLIVVKGPLKVPDSEWNPILFRDRCLGCRKVNVSRCSGVSNLLFFAVEVCLGFCSKVMWFLFSFFHALQLLQIYIMKLVLH